MFHLGSKSATAFTTHFSLAWLDGLPHSVAEREAVLSARNIILAAGLVGTASIAAPSEVERRYTRDYRQCVDGGNGGDAEITACISGEIERQDARLNQAYVMIMRQLSQPRKLVLRQSEREWIKRRDAGCSRNAAPERGGTLYDVVYSGCVLDTTIKRTLFLERYR